MSQKAQGASAQEQFAGVKPVDERHRLDETALERWMADHVEGFAGPLSLMQFKGGQSNPTYRIETPGRRYVLRRKPPGQLLQSAHAVDREFRVISALHPTGFPVARPYGLCEDDTVIGSMFYVMEMVEGRVLWDIKLPGSDPQERRAIYNAKIDTLAWLHRIDHVAVGLEDYGKPGNYFARQIGRWTKQYKASETETIPEMDRLMAWLPEHIPPGDETSIVHGDFRLDNMILHPTQSKVIAVIDWELSTLGHPLADFSYFLMQWVMPGEDRMGLAGIDIAALGIPSIEEAVARYCEQTGREGGIGDINYYFAYNMFRLAAILQGIAGRVRDGTAASEHAKAMAAKVTPLAQGAWAFAVAAGAEA